MFEQTLASTGVSPAPRGLTLAAAGFLEGLFVAALAAHALLAPEVLPPPVTLALFGAAQPPPPRSSTRPSRRPPAEGHPRSSPEPSPRTLEAPPAPPTVLPSPSTPPASNAVEPPAVGVEGCLPLSEPREVPPPVPEPRPVLRAFEVLPLRPLFQPPPVYPAPAAAMGLTGRVVLEILVDETGAVREARVVESTNPLFEGAALEAVRRWRYSRPVDARSGASVACILTVTVHFRLR